MKPIEKVNPGITPGLTEEISDFWSKNVNCEKIMGAKIAAAERGSSEYFQQLEQQRYRSHRHLLPWIKQLQPGKSVLEIGCGIGLDSYQLANQGLEVTSIDLTEVAINVASERFKRCGINGNFQVGNATDLQFPDNTFDYVYSFGVLHHTENTEKAVSEAYRVLKPGGEAKVMLYNRHSLNELVHRLTRIPFEDREELCPVVRRFSVGEVKRMFSAFESVTIHKDFVYGEGYGKLYKYTPRWLYRILSSVAGWHLMISARK